MSKLQVDDIVNKDDNGAVSASRGITGNLTGTASEASAAASGSALETAINAKTSTGKSIAMSMIFG
tara:strand:+ start:816 stop:1013 length:198 start_codon:yes stop_codon:yes gene_type:complete